MRGSVDYGDGYPRPVESCWGTIHTKGGDANVRDGAKALALNLGVAVMTLAVCKQGPPTGEVQTSSPV